MVDASVEAAAGGGGRLSPGTGADCPYAKGAPDNREAKVVAVKNRFLFIVHLAFHK